MAEDSRDPSTREFEANGRRYQPPARPIAVICIDGCADEYLDVSIGRGVMPHLLSMSVRGYRGMARAALPSFTNVNNSAIVTGAPPSVTGISGNFFLDPDSGEEVMMNSSRYLRCETILARAGAAGRRVGFVTAKEKLRDVLSAGLEGIAFSAEKARDATKETHGIDDVEEMVGAPTPEIYSGDASVYVLRAGCALVEKGLADFLYLSLTDFMQHKFAPETTESLDFYAEIDHEIGRLLELGAVVGVTADHGMNSKQQPDGSPNVVWLESVLKESFGAGCRVILPITDPYVLHHGALGSFAVVHVPAELTARRAEIAEFVFGLPGITEVHDRSGAAKKLELPEDRIGDIVVLSGRNVVIGRAPEHHDLDAVQDGLRSHGGRYEEMVPFIVSEPLEPSYARRAAGDVRNFDIFDFTVNGA